MRVLLLPVLLATSCAAFQQSGKSFVADSAAERIYQADRYDQLCVQVKGPAGCAEMQVALNQLKHDNEIANEVQKYGNLPAQEKAQIGALLKRIRSLP